MILFKQNCCNVSAFLLVMLSYWSVPLGKYRYFPNFWYFGCFFSPRLKCRHMTDLSKLARLVLCLNSRSVVKCRNYYTAPLASRCPEVTNSPLSFQYRCWSWMAEHSVTIQTCFYNVSLTKIYFENLENSFVIQVFRFFFWHWGKKGNASKLTGKGGNQYKGFIKN